MKPGPATSTLAMSVVGAQLLGERLGELARLLAGVLRQHHGGVGRHVAVAASRGGSTTMRDEVEAAREPRPAPRPARADAADIANSAACTEVIDIAS